MLSTETKGKSLAEILLVLMIVTSLMTVFINIFFENQATLRRSGFKNLNNLFSARVNAFHAQWQMDGQPKALWTKKNNTDTEDEKILVSLNDQGWVIATDKALACEYIWHILMERNLEYMNDIIVVKRINNENNHLYCQFGLPSGEYFTYNSDKGTTSKVFVVSDN